MTDDGLTPEQSDAKRQVGRYMIIEEIGFGGMGIVYAAHDPDLDRKLAIKLLHESHSFGSEGERALMREAQAMARLNHPNVVTVHDVGRHEGQVFLAMEYVEGATLDLWMRGRSWSEVLAAFIQAGRGLSAAHDAGVIHRDFKPANAMVDADGRVQVMDFGLARQADGEKTEDGVVAGTPAYMAPEQHLGLDIDAAADQFSFCVALYEGVYGERPFKARTVSQVFVEIERGEVSAPPLGTEVPTRLRKAIVRGLSQQPSDRWPSMQALLADLDAPPLYRRLPVAMALTLGAGAVLTTVLWTPTVEPSCDAGADLAGVWNAARRARVGTAIAGTGISYAKDTAERVAGMLDDYGAAWVAERTNACDARTTEMFDRRMSCLERNLAGMNAVAGVLEGVDADVLPNAVQMVDALPPPPRCADGKHLAAPGDPEVAKQVAAIEADLSEAEALKLAGRAKDALAVAKRAAAQARSANYEPVLAQALRDVGSLQQRTADFAGAERTLEEAFQRARSSGNDAVAALSAAELAYVVGYQSRRRDDGRQWAKHARAELDRLGGDRRIEARLVNNIGTLHFAAGEYEDALELFEQVAALRTAEYGDQDANTAAAHSNVGLVLAKLGRHAESLERHQTARRLWEASLGAEHPMVGISINNAAIVLEAQEQFDEAAAAYREAIAIRSKALGVMHPSVALYKNNLGNVLQAQRRYEDALVSHREALAIWREVHGPDHPRVASAHHGISTALRRLGRNTEALAAAEEAVRVLEAVGDTEHPDFADLLENLGLVLRDLGRREEAGSALERAYTVAVAALGEEHPHVVSMAARRAASD